MVFLERGFSSSFLNWFSSLRSRLLSGSSLVSGSQQFRHVWHNTIAATCMMPSLIVLHAPPQGLIPSGASQKRFFSIAPPAAVIFFILIFLAGAIVTLDHKEVYVLAAEHEFLDV
jgi:hypothetical protein